MTCATYQLNKEKSRENMAAKYNSHMEARAISESSAKVTE